MNDMTHTPFTDAEARPLPPGVIEFAGGKYLRDAKGALQPLDSIKPTDLLMDEVVRKISGYAEPLSAEVARFKQHTFDDVDNFCALLAQEYGASVGGKKGNITLTSYDGLLQVKIRMADNVVFGPELQVAKALFDECVLEWSQDSHVNIRALIQRAFNTEKEGLVNRAELLSLIRVQIEDERWARAVEAIRDSMRVIGTKRYVNVFRRSDPDAAWEAVTIDLAAA